MSEPCEPLASLLPDGRSFHGTRKVRLGDAGREGRLRLDALTRYTQDVSDDDTTDAGLAEDPGWVVRSTVVDELRSAVLGERLSFVTFCSGLGKRWAERRLTVRGEGGAHYEVATLWVCIDPDGGHPRSLTDQFMELYGSAAGGRKVSARLQNQKFSAHPVDEMRRRTWQLRASDYDVFDHVNNAAYWSVVEQCLPEAPAVPRRTRLEYGQGVPPADSVEVVTAAGSHGLLVWWLDDDQATTAAACAATVALPSDLYPPDPSPPTFAE